MVFFFFILDNQKYGINKLQRAGMNEWKTYRCNEITLTVRFSQDTTETVTFLSLRSSKVLLLGLSGCEHLQLHREMDTKQGN